MDKGGLQNPDSGSERIPRSRKCERQRQAASVGLLVSLRARRLLRFSQSWFFELSWVLLYPLKSPRKKGA